MDLRERQLHLQLAIKKMDGPAPPLVVSSMERLTDLLERAEPVLQAALPPQPPSVFHPSQPVADENLPSEQKKNK